VDCGDKVFLASITARLVHDIMQILFAVNKIYYVGDGSNLRFAEKFPILPHRFSERIESLLYPPPQEPVLLNQYTAMIALIDDVMRIVQDIQAEFPQ
jgi:hypothetical protein